MNVRSRRWMLLSISAVIAATGAGQSRADSLGVFGGRASSNGERHSAAWGVDYQHDLGRHVAIGGSYLNEGHAADNHRDGAALQLRLRTSILHPRLTLIGGAGPYYYFNTTRAGNGLPDTVDHGWGVLYSAAIRWDAGGAWYVEARAQRIEAGTSFDSTSVFAGIGVRLDPADRGHERAVDDGRAGVRQLALFGGRTIANTFQSQSAFAQAIEYRVRLADPLEWTLAVLHEGDTGPVRRYGVAAQVWGLRDIAGERLSIGAGIGPYLVSARCGGAQRDDCDDERLAGFASMTLAYAVAPAWRLRLVFNRVFAHRSRDTDVFLLGVGYRY